MDYRQFVPFLAAGLIAGLAYLFLRGFKLTFSRSPSARIEAFAETRRRGLADRLGEALIDHLGLRLEAWKHEFRWAQLGGHYQGQTVGGVLGRVVLFAGLGIAYILLFHAFSLVFAGAVLLLAYYPYMQLRSRAGEVRQMVKRSLPEAAALIAAEMSADVSAENALVRSASLPGPLGVLLREAIEHAQQAGRLLFSRQRTPGFLVPYLAGLRLPQLEAFAALMDMVASKGAEGPRQMANVARGLARDYRMDVSRQAETLDNKLLMPISVFFFVPFMLAIFIPLLVSIFQMF